MRLTPTRSLPTGWLPSSLAGARVLCLACGGGQQAPLMAAAGADVTVLDLTPAQLERDRLVAEREGLRLRLEQGHMGDLSRFADASFDLVFNPVSVTYIPDALPVFRECFRVLAPGGGLLFAAPHPHIYIFHGGDWDRGVLRVANRLPFSSLDERGKRGAPRSATTDPWSTAILWKLLSAANWPQGSASRAFTRMWTARTRMTLYAPTAPNTSPPKP